MKTTTLFMTLLSVASPLFAAAQPPATQNFKVRATEYRGATPALNGYIDVDSTDKSVGFGRAGSDYAGFVNWMHFDPVDGLPDGPLYRLDDNAQGYILPTDTPNLYEFFIGSPPPSNAWTSGFSIAPLSCGGQCGGLQLVFDEPNANRKWIAYPEESGEGYQIKYWNGAGDPPAGGYPVWLWKESA